MTYRIRNVVVAVGLALLAMMLTLFYVTNYKRSVQRDASSVQVCVAAKDVQAGTAGTDLVKRKDLKVESVPRSAVVPGAISNPDQLGSLVRFVDHQLDDPGRKPRCFESLDDQAVSSRAALGGLQDNRVPAGEGGGDCPTAEDHRSVPWRDAEDHSDRLA